MPRHLEIEVMGHPNPTEFERRLARQSYQTIHRELGRLSSRELLVLLDSKSIKIGDTAAGLLHQRTETELLINALLSDHIRTPIGRVRATNVLSGFGRAIPEAVDAYVHSLDDRSEGVLSNALFGIVFMRRRDLLAALQERFAVARPGSARHQLLRKAIEALRANDPSLYSPGFHDAANVWRLNEPA
jgi:hypothetical protein